MVRHDTGAAGRDWLKTSGGHWGDTTELVEAGTEYSRSGAKVVPRNSSGRWVRVDWSQLRRAPQVVKALLGGAERSHAQPSGISAQTGYLEALSSGRPAAAAPARPAKTSHVAVLAVAVLPATVAALIASELKTIGLAADGHPLSLAFGVSVVAGTDLYGAWRAWLARPRRDRSRGRAAQLANWGRRRRVVIGVIAMAGAVLLHADHSLGEAESVVSGIVLGAVCVAEADLLAALGRVLLHRRHREPAAVSPPRSSGGDGQHRGLPMGTQVITAH